MINLMVSSEDSKFFIASALHKVQNLESWLDEILLEEDESLHNNNEKICGVRRLIQILVLCLWNTAYGRNRKGREG